MQGSVQKRLNEITGRIARAAERAGRQPDEIQLVAVTKMVPEELLEEAISSGLNVFGENRVQDFLPKYEAINNQVEWHFIGHLQQNKAKYLSGRIGLLHSLDSLRLAQVLDHLGVAQGYPWRVLIQVNVAGEDTKYGLQPEKLSSFLDDVRYLQWLVVCGLMTIAPYTDNPEKVRPVFRKLRILKDEMSQTKPWLRLRHLSMGMSNDFEIAIEEGATLVRIGSALFGY